MTVITRDHCFDLWVWPLRNVFLNQREVMIFFLKVPKSVYGVLLKAGILEYLDITGQSLLGKESFTFSLKPEKFPFSRKSFLNFRRQLLKKAGNSLTQIENDSILHSAVLSNEPEMIHEAVKIFSKFCGHHNSYSMSPLKLALVNGNSFESIKGFLLITIVWMKVITLRSKALTGIRKFFYHEMKDSLDKMAKWAPMASRRIPGTFEAAFDAINLHDSSRMIKDALFIGLLNSYRRFNSNLDRILDEDYISSPYSRSWSQSQASPDNRTALIIGWFSVIKVSILRMGFLLKRFHFPQFLMGWISVLPTRKSND